GVDRLDKVTDEDLAALEAPLSPGSTAPGTSPRTANGPERPPLAERARELLAENERTRHAAEALEEGNPVELGRLLTASQDAQETELNAAAPELSGLIRLARITAGVLGARISREDRAGCFVSVVESETAASELERRLRSFYFARTGFAPLVVVTETGEPGARLEARASA
ncbi:MAG: hypothetical protein HY814_12585, partial [Candidatus Riflebacteria bacterium]|nr:hypothetical protein [Candidatus Riflebacteria bacterium]